MPGRDDDDDLGPVRLPARSHPSQHERSERGEPRSPTDDRPPICPACGVTMGTLVVRGGVRHACLECGYRDEV